MSEHALDIADDLDGVSNVLLMEDGSASANERVHEALLSGLDSEAADVLVVTFAGADTWLDAWEDSVSTESAHLGLVQLTENDVDEGRRGGAYVRSVDPTDLTGLGMAVRDFFDGVGSRSNPTVVCFDSVSELTAYHDVRTLFRFLRVVTQQINQADAVGHFHLNPVAHDDQSLARLTPPFDAAVEYSEGGEQVSVSRTH
ncbi:MULTISPECIES: hypothetical protein [Halobacterium]|uniref:DUF7504 family protein n=1 Tax=Halobacterium TaxID=2239 RepID=UPI00073ED9A5|nr:MULTISPECIES: hypothetical protein [Halobacterium]MCG1002996.1 DUF835 domain-containing protein [Halobacterium noricense]